MSLPNPPEEQENNEAIDPALRDTLNATAELLPFLEQQKTPRFTPAQHQRWSELSRQLDIAWQAQQKGQQVTCREEATALVELALELNDVACLLLAEAIADAASAAETPSLLAAPIFRAAFNAALEILAAPDGPEQRALDDKARHIAERLSHAKWNAHTPPLVPPSARWFAEDAQEHLIDLQAALDALPPQRLQILSSLQWIEQQEGSSGVAIRGLAKLAHNTVQQMRRDDLDATAHHDLLKVVIQTLSNAIDQLGRGYPPQADETIFAALRELEARLLTQRALRNSSS